MAFDEMEKQRKSPKQIGKKSLMNWINRLKRWQWKCWGFIADLIVAWLV